jgi:hypothetical protein
MKLDNEPPVRNEFGEIVLVPAYPVAVRILKDGVWVVDDEHDWVMEIVIE